MHDFHRQNWNDHEHNLDSAQHFITHFVEGKKNQNNGGSFMLLQSPPTSLFIGD
jgi:hypothetical protein